MSPAGWLPRTRISSGTLRSVIEYELPLPFPLQIAGLCPEAVGGGANVVDSARSVRAAARRVRGRPLYVRPGYCVWRRARRREFIMAIIISVALARSAMSTRS